MKKEYINPEMKVIKMKTMTVLAASDPQPVNENATSKEGVYDDAPSFFDGDSEDW
jgi:hypothetical protein